MRWLGATPKPKLSVVVVFHNMRREAKRTLWALSTEYQRGVSADDYEVIAVDSNSSEPLDSNWVRQLPGQFHHLVVTVDNPSPCRAVNTGVREARGDWVCVMVDGARIPTPELLHGFLKARLLDQRAFAYSLGMHLGKQRQNLAVLEGYSQVVEDELLATVDWQKDGYELFKISCLAGSSRGGYFANLAESNCFALSKQSFLALGGYDERFITRGGGFVNLDFFRQAVETHALAPYMLLGEATFHQFHGGVATNTPHEQVPFAEFRAEYQRIRGCEYQVPKVEPNYIGRLPKFVREATTP